MPIVSIRRSLLLDAHNRQLVYLSAASQVVPRAAPR